MPNQKKKQTLLNAIFIKFEMKTKLNSTGQKDAQRRGVQGVVPAGGKGSGWDSEARLFPHPLCQIFRNLLSPAPWAHICVAPQSPADTRHRWGCRRPSRQCPGQSGTGLWAVWYPTAARRPAARAARSPRPAAPLAALPFGCPQASAGSDPAAALQAKRTCEDQHF